MFFRFVCCLALGSIIHHGGCGQTRFTEETASADAALVRRQGQTLQVQMASDGSMHGITTHARRGVDSGKPVDGAEVIKRRRTQATEAGADHQGSSALLQTRSCAGSIFSLARTRALFTFSSYLAGLGVAPNTTVTSTTTTAPKTATTTTAKANVTTTIAAATTTTAKGIVSGAVGGVTDGATDVANEATTVATAPLTTLKEHHLTDSWIFYVLVTFAGLFLIAQILAAVFNRTGGQAQQNQGDAAGAAGDEGAAEDENEGSPADSGGSGTPEEKYREKELTVSPAGLHEDIYGMGIAAIVRDSQRFAMKTELFTLRASRLSVTILVLMFTMTLQVFLIYEMKHLVTSVSTHEARDNYDKYEIAMYGNDLKAMETTVNGYHRGVASLFNISNFATLSDDLKDSACQMPLSQPSFFIGILLIWTLVCMADMRTSTNLGGALLWYTPTISSMSEATEDTPETGDEAVIVVGLTVTVKAIIGICILLPRLLVAGVLLWLGCRWLCGTMGFSDVLQNTVTLEFILLLKDLFYNVMAPHHNKVETRNTLILPDSNRQNPSKTVFLGAFAWGILAIVWVLLYVEYFQQVLPEYNWDIHDACQDYLSSIETATP